MTPKPPWSITFQLPIALMICISEQMLGSQPVWQRTMGYISLATKSLLRYSLKDYSSFQGLLGVGVRSFWIFFIVVGICFANNRAALISQLILLASPTESCLVPVQPRSEQKKFSSRCIILSILLATTSSCPQPTPMPLILQPATSGSSAQLPETQLSRQRIFRIQVRQQYLLFRNYDYRYSGSWLGLVSRLWNWGWVRVFVKVRISQPVCGSMRKLPYFMFAFVFRIYLLISILFALPLTLKGTKFLISPTQIPICPSPKQTLTLTNIQKPRPKSWSQSPQTSMIALLGRSSTVQHFRFIRYMLAKIAVLYSCQGWQDGSSGRDWGLGSSDSFWISAYRLLQLFINWVIFVL